MLSLSTRSQTREYMLAEIKAYIQSLPDSDRWKDFFDASTGKTVIDIIIGIAELLIYKLEIRSLDSYLPTAITQSATYLLAQMVGYNPNRRSHALGEVTVRFTYVPDTALVIPEGFVFDSAPIPIVSTAPVTVPSGVSTVVVPVMQGQWKTATFSAEDGNLVGQKWESIYIDEPDFKIDQREVYILVDGEECEIVDKIDKVTSKSVLVRTDYRGGVLLLFGDGIYGVRLYTSSVVRVNYLLTDGLSGVVYRDTDLGRYAVNNRVFHSTVSSTIQGGSDQDSIEKVKFLASKFFQTQGRAVTGYDYEAVVMSYPGIISARCKRIDDDCCTICISALKEGHTEWTNPEILDLYNYLDDYKMISTKIEFHDPVGIPIDMNVTLNVRSTNFPSSIDQVIREYITNTYCYQLKSSLYASTISNDILSLSNDIVRVRINDINDLECYPDIVLLCNQYFYPRDIVVNRVAL